MQLHVVSGRGVAPHYSTLPRIGSPSNLSFSSGAEQQQPNAKFTERGAPEGAASNQPCDVALSPTNNVQNPTIPANVVNQINGPSKSTAAAQTTSAVYYAMNI